MDQFYVITLAIAIGLLILILTYIGVYITDSESKKGYPPESLQCPDYWEKDKADGCTIPTGDTNKGTFVVPSDSTNNPEYIEGIVLKTSNELWQTNDGLSGKCAKKQWATNHGIVWDGISNYNNC